MRKITAVLFLIGILATAAARAANYDAQQTNTYVAQTGQLYCGRTSTLIMLNSTTVNKNPLPSQLTLYNAGQAYNNALPVAQQTSYATSPGATPFFSSSP